MIFAFSSLSDILLESAIGISVVFTALTLLVFAFLISAKLSTNTLKKRSIKSGTPEEKTSSLDTDKMAAISVALHLYLQEEEIHDQESNVITIKRIQKRYSPWSSKIYGINNFQK
ncbi:MAG: OadG family protein [Paludibacteraceae bacterium]